MLLEKMAIKVPMKLNIRIVPMFLKKGFFCILYPLSKMMGGSNKIMNRLTKWSFNFFMYKVTPRALKIAPVIIPIKVVSPASYK